MLFQPQNQNKFFCIRFVTHKKVTDKVQKHKI